MMPLPHLPPLFRIGVKPLREESRFDVDDLLSDYLKEKERLGAERFAAVFAAEPKTEAAQCEVLELVLNELQARFPDIYQRSGDVVDIVPAQRQIRLDADMPPLWVAAQLVPEDLVLMRKAETGWRLAAAALCFPSSWRLRDKFGKPLREVHQPVPEFGEGTRNATMIERMFDNLRPDISVVRGNWSLYGNDDLFHPASAESDKRRFGDGTNAENVFLRRERQTLSKLPMSGDILFTIRIYVDPLETIEASPDKDVIARQLLEQIEALDAEQLAYKGLTMEKDRINRRLGKMLETPQ